MLSTLNVFLSILFVSFVFFFMMFFFFKQKTAYEMRISDWSSDVCSSDLVLDGQAVAGRENAGAGAAQEALHPYAGQFARRRREPDVELLVRHPLPHRRGTAGLELNGDAGMCLAKGRDHTRQETDRERRKGRSEERRVGKECVSTCRSRGGARH